MPSSNPKQSRSKAPAATTSVWAEYMDTAAEAKGTQVGSKSVTSDGRENSIEGVKGKDAGRPQSMHVDRDIIER